MKPPRPRIVKPRLVWRLIGGNWKTGDNKSSGDDWNQRVRRSLQTGHIGNEG